MRKDAPNDLLVETDVQPKLGLSVVMKDDDGGMTDLFTDGRIVLSETVCNKRQAKRSRRPTQFVHQTIGGT